MPRNVVCPSALAGMMQNCVCFVCISKLYQPIEKPDRTLGIETVAGDAMRQVLLQHLHDAKIQDGCGKVLYSSINTLKKGPVYLLGYNPGGDPAKEFMTLAEHVSQSPPDWNEYVDAEWMPRGIRCPAGQALLQRRVRWLLEQLGLQTREVCASNLIFGRSKSQADLSNEQMLADCCWPIHEWIMEQVQPRMILCIGGSKIPDYMIRKGEADLSKNVLPSMGD